MITAAALSEHPLTTNAVGECVGHLLERIGTGPTFVFVAVTTPHVGALEDIVATVRSVLNPQVVVGCVGSSLVGGPTEVEQRAAVTMFACTAPTLTSTVVPVRLELGADPAGLRGIDSLAGASGTLLLVGEMSTAASSRLIAQLAAVAPDLRVVGGVTTCVHVAGPPRLALDDRVYRQGAVGVRFPNGADVQSVVSHGGAPFGGPWTVTSSSGHWLQELAGRPAVERLVDTFGPAAAHDLVDRGQLAVGVAPGLGAAEPEPNDFVLHPVVSVADSGDSIVLSSAVETGATVRWFIRNPTTVSADLR
ncbi:MAG: FIST N-terminal domain-containing protein, partial [Actinomycetes bacterium]